MSTAKTCYVVSFRDPLDGKIRSLKVKNIGDSSLGLSFIALADFVFETSSVLVDPETEYLKKQYSDVKTLHLSIYSIISIAEVGEHKSPLHFANDKAKLLVLNNESH